MHTKVAVWKGEASEVRAGRASQALRAAPPAIYVLGVWSVKKVNSKWYISQAAVRSR